MSGEVPKFVATILNCANECATRKKDCGIRPIAVGSTIRRLSVKVGSKPVVQALDEELMVVQLGLQPVRDERRQGLSPQKGPSGDIYG